MAIIMKKIIINYYKSSACMKRTDSSVTRSPIPAVIVIALMTVFAGCAQQTQDAEQKVVATFFPVAQAASAVVGDTATVVTVVPPGTEPHGYEPSPSIIRDVDDARAFVTLGVEFAQFETSLAQATRAPIIDASAGVELLDVEGHDHGDEEQTEERNEDEHAEEHAGKDPHIWTSPKNMAKMVDNIATQMAAIDPQRAAVYERNAQQYKRELDALDASYREGLASCRTRTILVNHQAFSYLAREYAIKQVAITGLEPESEPTPQQIRAIIDQARAEDIKYVLMEDLVDPRVGQTIALEAGTKTLTLNPGEGTSDPAATYISIMRDNLAVLRTAMECT